MGLFLLISFFCGFSGVIYNYLGKWIVGYDDKSSSHCRSMVELEAIQHGLELALTYNLVPLIVKTDSVEVIHPSITLPRHLLISFKNAG